MTQLLTKKLQKQIAGFERDIIKASERTIRETGKRAKAIAVAAAPSRTGGLKRSIKLELYGLMGKLVAYAEHALFVEFGDEGHKEVPFMRPARAFIKEFLPEELNRQMAKIFKGRGGT